MKPTQISDLNTYRFIRKCALALNPETKSFLNNLFIALLPFLHYEVTVCIRERTFLSRDENRAIFRDSAP